MRKRTSSLLITSFLLVPLFGGACGKSDEGHNIITPTVDGLAQTLCDFAFRCCSPGEVGFYVAPFINAENCTDRLMDATLAPSSVSLTIPAFHGLTVSIPNLGSLDRAIREKRTIIDSEALAACKAYLDGLACNVPDPTSTDTACKPFEPPPEDTPCDPRNLFVGRLHEGDACTSDGLSYECGPGLYCGRNLALGQTGQCISTGHIGDHCLEDFECDEGLYCSMLDGTCMAPRGAGETCVYADHLDPNPPEATLLVRCQDDLACDPITHTCVVHCQQGAPCGSDDDCDQTDTANPLQCITGRCDYPRDVGLPCANTVDCKEGLRCIPGERDPSQYLCSLREVDGAPCAVNTDCQSEFCDRFTAGTTPKCAPKAAPNALCPTGYDDQCLDGLCQGNNGATCTVATQAVDCGVGKCNAITSRCQNVCVALKIDNSLCDYDGECVSQTCVYSSSAAVQNANGFCRTLPLAEGTECESDYQCDTDFCSRDAVSVCTRLPLVNGARCDTNEQCDSLVCFPQTSTSYIEVCTAGLLEGDQCGGGNAPCDPKALYCNYDLEPPLCVPLHETGEPCKSSVECRGSCVIRNGRQMCNDVPKPDEAICDGQAAPATAP